MSRQNVEIVKQAIDGFNRRDADYLVELATADCEWFPAVVSRLDPKAQITSHQQGHWAVRQRSEHAYKTDRPHHRVPLGTSGPPRLAMHLSALLEDPDGERFVAPA
jgi:ketosteroid isomerase-like protein